MIPTRSLQTTKCYYLGHSHHKAVSQVWDEAIDVHPQVTAQAKTTSSTWRIGRDSRPSDWPMHWHGKGSPPTVEQGQPCRSHTEKVKIQRITVAHETVGHKSCREICCSYILMRSPSFSVISGSLFRGEKWQTQLLTETLVGKAIPGRGKREPPNLQFKIICSVYERPDWWQIMSLFSTNITPHGSVISLTYSITHPMFRPIVNVWHVFLIWRQYDNILSPSQKKAWLWTTCPI